MKLPAELPTPTLKKTTKQRLVGELDLQIVNHAERLIGQGEFDQGYQMLCECILNSSPLIDPEKSPKSTPLSLEINKLKWSLMKLHRKLNRSQSPEGLAEYAAKKKEYKELVKTEKQELKKKEDEIKIQKAELLPWKLNPRRNGNFCKVQPEEWNPHFSKLYNPKIDLPPPVEHDYSVNCADDVDPAWFEDCLDCSELNAEITISEAKSVLNSCSDKKAVGEDEISNEHLKGSFHVVGYLWILLFNFILLTGNIISIWRTSIVKVLYKGRGDQRDPNSYRGIALLSHVFKWFTKIIANRLYLFAEERALPREQFGFRKGRSTFDALFKLRCYIVEGLSIPKTPVFAVFVDFSKAFDMVPRNLLLRKLATLHLIRGKILHVIAVILEFNLIQVFDGVSTSEKILQTRGVQQGDSLSPLLFILFISDLPILLREISCHLKSLLFADDLVLFSTSKEDIQRALDILCSFCKRNKMEVNLDKTKVLKFRRGGPFKEVFLYDGNPVQHCSSYNYLGITLQATWCFSKHIKKVRAKAAAASYKIRNLQKLSVEAAKKYFQVMIEPIILLILKLNYSYHTLI